MEQLQFEFVIHAPYTHVSDRDSTPMSCQAKQNYVGTYQIRDVEIHYTIPAALVGAPAFTRKNRAFRDDRHLGIFDTSYGVDLNGGPASCVGLDLGIAPAPMGVAWADDIAPYAVNYERKLRRAGLTGKIDVVTIEGRKWLRVQQFFPTGNLARVLYVTKLFDDFNLVCLVGMMNGMFPEYKAPDASQWSTQAESVLRSVTIVRASHN